jgi:hypothetical protein
MRTERRAVVRSRRAIAWLFVGLGGVVAVFAAVLAESTPDGAAASGLMPDDPQSADPPDASVHEQYAEARLRLAKLQLSRAEEIERRFAGVVTAGEMRRLRNRVELLRQHLDATRSVPHGNGIDEQVAAARVRVSIAEKDLEAARAVRRRNEAAISANELEQYEVKVEIARLRRDLWSDRSFRDSPLRMMQMQIDQLTDFVVDAVDAIDGTPTMQRP